MMSSNFCICSGAIFNVLLILIYCDVCYANSKSSNSIFVARSDGILCADTLLPIKVNQCPRSIIMFFGKLKPVTCKQLGYTKFQYTEEIRAGPCGKIEFKFYKHHRVKQKHFFFPDHYNIFQLFYSFTDIF